MAKTVLIVIRHEVFYPWISGLQADLASNGYKVLVHFLEKPKRHDEKNSYFKQRYLTTLDSLRAIHNFFFLTTWWDSEMLYARDWLSDLPRLINGFLRKIKSSRSISIILKYLSRKMFTLMSKLPIYGKNTDELFQHSWDIVMAFPCNMPGSIEYDFIRRANREKIATHFSTISIDNLFTKGALLEPFTEVQVWNEKQKQIVQDRHRVKGNRIKISKSSFFSSWLNFIQSSKSETGSDSQSQLSTGLRVLYLCSSKRIGFWRETEQSLSSDERNISNVITWLNAQENGVISELVIRRHPDAPKPILIIPKGLPFSISVVSESSFPKNQDAAEEFLKTIKRVDLCIGLNTSALIQSAMCNIPSYVFLSPGLEHLSTNTPHLREIILANVVQILDSKSELKDVYNKKSSNSLVDNVHLFTGLKTITKKN